MTYPTPRDSERAMAEEEDRMLAIAAAAALGLLLAAWLVVRTLRR